MTELNPSLSSARLKLRRADELVKALSREINSYFESQPYEILTGLQRDPDTGGATVPEEFVGIIRVCRAPSEMWPIIVGEIVHNLRSALDHIVWQLVLLNTGKLPPDTGTGSQTQFPISDTKPGFDSVATRCLYGVNQSAQAFIESLQPFATGEGPSGPLSQLRALSNWDKHNSINVVLMHSTESSIWGRSGYFDEMAIATSGPVVNGSQIFRVIFSPSDVPFEERLHKSKVSYKVVIDMAFQCPAAVRSKSVRATLDRIGARVAEIGSRIDEAFFAPTQPLDQP